MSDTENTIESAAPEVANTEATAPEQKNSTQETAAPEVTKTEVAKPDPEYDEMARFRKPDGSLDTDRLAKSYRSLEKRFSSKPNIPAASAEEYEWQAPENAVELPEEGLAAFKAEALAEGFTPKQYKFLMSRYNDVVLGMRDAGPTAEKAETVLKAEWGKNYTEQLQAAQAGFNEFAPSDANPNDPVWNHPAVMKLLARIGSEVKEDSISPKGAVAGSADSVQDQINALRNSPDYWKPENQVKVNKLYERLVK